jgi:hypothetical protein
MEMPGFGVCGEVGDEVELPKQLFDDLAGVIALAEMIDLRHHAGEHAFGLLDGGIGKILALLLETPVMLREFLAKEGREALA